MSGFGFAHAKWLPLVVALIVGMTANVGAREFRVADTQAPDYPTVRALVKLGELVSARTGGRHGIRVFHSHELGDEKDTIEQTLFGALEMDRVNVAPLGALMPEAQVLSMPFLFTSIDHLHHVIDGPIGEEILASFERHGLIGLTFYNSGARSIYNSKRSIHTVADLLGLRIRVQHSDVMFEMARALGAIPVDLAYGQVEIGLATGLVDGAENNWQSYVGANHYRFAPFLTLTEHAMPPEVLVMSPRAWRSLSNEDQAIFRASARETSLFMREQWNTLENRSRRQAEEAGVSIYSDFDRKPFEDAMGEVYRKAGKNPAIAMLIERIRQVK